ncbi:putative uba ts-n domain-containing protein [Eutypa lata UCREL1]|uniref:Putative uba ts-n domain-containing protein n=1 Tax=Eutypa lata (strain UCR-EL1) TaxID=1287681 RepID=M7T0Z3_EUTLA|nr:putative uba ts-n domain-containing protein [Eutypa lata UCREL1]
MNPPSTYPTLRPTPSPQTSARNTPLSTQASGFAAPKSAASKPGVDTFSNLVNFGNPKSNANLSLRERQQQLEAEKRQREEEQRKKLQSQYGGGQFWDSLGQGSSTASRTVSPAAPSIGAGIGASATPSKDDDEDLFAAFNKDTKVDTSSHFPRPAQPTSGTSTPANAAKLNLANASAWSQPTASNGGDFGDDDDPFGLNQIKPRAQPQPPADVAGDDDILGDLGKPVDQVRRQAPPQPKAEPGKPIEDFDSDSDSSSEPESHPRGGSSDPFDKAVAELVDMGFSPENARRGLTENGAGLNVQAAVGWLLDDAHKQARNKQTPRDSPAERNGREENSRSRNNGSPAWMSEGQPSGEQRRKDNSSPAYGDDISKKAAAMGNSFFKTANSLWKTGQKQVQKAVADFQQDGRDPSSPKQAVEDANAVIGIVGPSRGEGEKVALPDGEQRDMKDLYGKALSRKAEALEQMEKWSEAGDIWQQCVEAGVGGTNAITGRQRCQKALAPKPKPTPRPIQATKPRPKPSAMADLGPQKSSEAVQRLRDANKAAETADEEKFALGEKVDGRISAWRDGKRDNLRALLGSLDQVLWEGSGWKKVGLHELVIANKVKIHYMKAIAKCHPDKLPQDANTEVKLIAATVFATLNESWDKFKADNGL